jgi:hypothetical protein
MNQAPVQLDDLAQHSIGQFGKQYDRIGTFVNLHAEWIEAHSGQN